MEVVTLASSSEINWEGPAVVVGGGATRGEVTQRSTLPNDLQLLFPSLLTSHAGEYTCNLTYHLPGVGPTYLLETRPLVVQSMMSLAK